MMSLPEIRQAGFVMAGTYGAVVTDGTDVFILSNNHVLANENDLPLGNTPLESTGKLPSCVRHFPMAS